MMVQRGPLDFIARSVVFQPSGLSGGTATGDITLKDGTGNSAAFFADFIGRVGLNL